MKFLSSFLAAVVFEVVASHHHSHHVYTENAHTHASRPHSTDRKHGHGHTHNSPHPTPAPTKPTTLPETTEANTAPQSTTAPAPAPTTTPNTPPSTAPATTTPSETTEAPATTMVTPLPVGVPRAGSVEFPFGTEEQKREVEGFIKDTLDSYFHHGKHNDYHDHDEYHYYDHYHYHNQTKLCYELDFLEHATFNDISSTGTMLDPTVMTTSGYDSFTSATTFKFYETTLTNPGIFVYLNGFVAFEEYVEANAAPNLADSEQPPYSVLAPLFSSFNLNGNANQLTSPAVYYTTSSSSTVIQWEVNEDGSFDQPSSRGKAIFQMHIDSNNLFTYKYKLVECDVPRQSCAQIGVKPSQYQWSDGYKASRRGTYCNDQEYLLAKSGSGVLLHPYPCNKLIGKTGKRIPRPPPPPPHSKKGKHF